MKQKIELTTVEDVKEFNAVVNAIPEKVLLTGYDENGNSWNINGKSLLATLVMVDDKRKCSARNVDWNTIECVCEKDIYNAIRKWAVGSQLEA